MACEVSTTSKYYIYNNALCNTDELRHYGVRGMKWGVRRYRNADGTLTKEGKRQARKEYREDNKTAYELGKAATIAGYATVKSLKRTIKLENKLDPLYEKDPSGSSKRIRSLKKKWDASSKTMLELADHYNNLRNKAEAHCKSLIDKYGEDAVRKISYKDHKLPVGEFSPRTFRTMNERTNSIPEYAIRAGLNTVSTTLFLAGKIPIAHLSSPKSTSSKARDVERRAYRNNRNAMR